MCIACWRTLCIGSCSVSASVSRSRAALGVCSDLHNKDWTAASKWGGAGCALSCCLRSLVPGVGLQDALPLRDQASIYDFQGEQLQYVSHELVRPDLTDITSQTGL